jgi:hypothetical protein
MVISSAGSTSRQKAVLYIYVEDEPAKEFMGAVARTSRRIAAGGMTLQNPKQEAAEAVRNGLNVLASLKEGIRFAAGPSSGVARPPRRATETSSVTLHRHGTLGGTLAAPVTASPKRRSTCAHS